MIAVKVSDEMLINSRNKAKELGNLRRSITRGQGNLAGFVGEEIALKVLGGKFDNLEKNVDYDIILPNEKTVDVKTKRTSVEPKPFYECSINTYYKQKCDYYAFIRVHNDLHVGWFLGWYDRNSYYKDSTHFKKGDKDPSNNFTFKADAYNMPISKLLMPEVKYE
jgi:hypothetical protein